MYKIIQWSLLKLCVLLNRTPTRILSHENVQKAINFWPVNGKKYYFTTKSENVRSGTGRIRRERIVRNKGNKETKASSKHMKQNK